MGNRIHLYASNRIMSQTRTGSVSADATHIWLDWNTSTNTPYAAAVNTASETVLTTPLTNPTTTAHARGIAAENAAILLRKTELPNPVVHIHTTSGPLAESLNEGRDTGFWNDEYETAYEGLQRYNSAVHHERTNSNPVDDLITHPYTEENPFWGETRGIGVADTPLAKTRRMFTEPHLRCIAAHAIRGTHPVIYREDSNGRYHALYDEYAVVIEPEQNHVVIVTQMHKHADYRSEDEYTHVQQVPAPVPELTFTQS